MSKTALINAFADSIGRMFGILFLLGTFGLAVYFSVCKPDFAFAALFYSPSIIFALVSLIMGKRK